MTFDEVTATATGNILNAAANGHLNAAMITAKLHDYVRALGVQVPEPEPTTAAIPAVADAPPADES